MWRRSRVLRKLSTRCLKKRAHCRCGGPYQDEKMHKSGVLCIYDRGDWGLVRCQCEFPSLLFSIFLYAPPPRVTKWPLLRRRTAFRSLHCPRRSSRFYQTKRQGKHCIHSIYGELPSQQSRPLDTIWCVEGWSPQHDTYVSHEWDTVRYPSQLCPLPVSWRRLWPIGLKSRPIGRRNWSNYRGIPRLAEVQELGGAYVYLLSDSEVTQLALTSPWMVLLAVSLHSTLSKLL